MYDVVTDTLRRFALQQSLARRPCAHLAAAAAHVVARLSEFIADFRDEIAEVEINPLAVLERGVSALDCLVIPLTASYGPRS